MIPLWMPEGNALLQLQSKCSLCRWTHGHRQAFDPDRRRNSPETPKTQALSIASSLRGLSCSEYLQVTRVEGLRTVQGLGLRDNLQGFWVLRLPLPTETPTPNTPS